MIKMMDNTERDRWTQDVPEHKNHDDADSRGPREKLQKKTRMEVEKTTIRLKKGVDSAKIADACREKLPPGICDKIASIQDRETALRVALKAFKETVFTQSYEVRSRTGKIRTETARYKIAGYYFLLKKGILKK